ncbi:MAG: DUF2892 domain-containing protein [Bacteroidota bacterium]
MKLTKNMGQTDRIIRVIVVIALLLLSSAGIPGGITGLVFAGLAGVFLVTSLAGSCPLYIPFSIRTTNKQ